MLLITDIALQRQNAVTFSIQNYDQNQVLWFGKTVLRFEEKEKDNENQFPFFFAPALV